MRKRVLFITGTRADFGKQKALMQAVKDHPDFDLGIFCTGMHLMSKYGHTYTELLKAGFGEFIFHYLNQVEGESMEMTLSNTIEGLSRYLHENRADIIIVHGDRVEALAGATAGALRNQLVGHVEGGEVSGTIDDLMRHATSKMAHIHFVANAVAKKRLIQLGEREDSIFQIGSPDVDVMFSSDLPTLEDAKARYDVGFEKYAIAILHPVTTEVESMKQAAKCFVRSLVKSNQKYLVVYPNNDLGSELIYEELQQLRNNPNFKVYPSLRFEYFLTLLKSAQFIIGNSSTGIHEAPVYGVPTIDIGTRQKNRFEYKSIVNIGFDEKAILENISEAIKRERFEPTTHYGEGNSAELFMQVLESKALWVKSKQKQFVDID